MHYTDWGLCCVRFTFHYCMWVVALYRAIFLQFCHRIVNRTQSHAVSTTKISSGLCATCKISNRIFISAEKIDCSREMAQRWIRQNKSHCRLSARSPQHYAHRWISEIISPQQNQLSSWLGMFVGSVCWKKKSFQSPLSHHRFAEVVSTLDDQLSSVTLPFRCCFSNAEALLLLRFYKHSKCLWISTVNSESLA